jgi:hypothetical protein
MHIDKMSKSRSAGIRIYIFRVTEWFNITSKVSLLLEISGEMLHFLFEFEGRGT